MSNFVFDSRIPAAQNNPSSDQPKMLANNIANEGIWDVDHIGFNSNPSNNGGTHLQTSFEGFSAGTLIAATAASVAYPAAGVADATRAEYYFKNSAATFFLSSIKAFGSFTVTAGGTTFINSNNVTLLTNGSGQISTITISAGATSGTTFNVIPFITGNQSLTYAITGANTFTLTTGAAGVGQIISFIVFQA